MLVITFIHETFIRLFYRSTGITNDGLRVIQRHDGKI